MQKLGELKRLDPREAWKHEKDFTTWLRLNLSKLAEVLGLDLDLVNVVQEATVGDFSADLVAKDVNSGKLVIIENQLDATDHRHFGQVLTYAANKKAGFVAWISPEFRDEHREAIEWLNAIAHVSQEGVDFFGLQIELLQIENSPPAPNFSIVAKPNAWEPPPPRLLQDNAHTTNSLAPC
jgi:hypothetical protein